MSNITGLHHLSAFTKDVKKNIWFYTKVLGLKLVYNTVHHENYKIRHLFFGDQVGSPGSLLTFFVYPKMGKSYFKRVYFGRTNLGVPLGALNYWRDRLQAFNVSFQERGKAILLEDPDGMPLRLSEVNELLNDKKVVIHSPVPKDKQITRILGQEVVVQDIRQEKDFLTNWLDLKEDPITNDSRTFTLPVSKSISNERSRMGHGTIDHLALGVDRQATLKQLKKLAEEKGYKIDLFKKRGFFTSLYVKSPNGNRYEVATNGPGFPVHEYPYAIQIPEHFKDRSEEIIELLGGDLAWLTQN